MIEGQDSILAWLAAQPSDAEIRNGIIEECALEIESHMPDKRFSITLGSAAAIIRSLKTAQASAEGEKR